MKKNFNIYNIASILGRAGLGIDDIQKVMFEQINTVAKVLSEKLKELSSEERERERSALPKKYSQDCVIKFELEDKRPIDKSFVSFSDFYSSVFRKKMIAFCDFHSSILNENHVYRDDDHKKNLEANYLLINEIRECLVGLKRHYYGVLSYIFDSMDFSSVIIKEFHLNYCLEFENDD